MATMSTAAHSASAWSVGTSIVGGVACASARLVWRKQPGTEKTHSAGPHNSRINGGLRADYSSSSSSLGAGGPSYSGRLLMPSRVRHLE